jgi:hypothetical protein
MLLNICFGFMMLIASLIEFSISQNADVKNHKIQLANFDKASFACIKSVASTARSLSGGRPSADCSPVRPQ